MATFLTGGRMVALFLCMLFALNASFAQGGWTTVVVYMEDPIPLDEQFAPEVREYLDKFNDPFTWVTEQDFKDAREAQEDHVDGNNKTRIRKAEEFLREDMARLGNGTSSWYPSWIPLGFAKTAEDSIFKNILNLRGGRPYPSNYVPAYKAGLRQSVREFFIDHEGKEPYGDDFRECDDARPRCRKELYGRFRALFAIYDDSIEPQEDQISPSLLVPALFPALTRPFLPSSLPPSLLLPDEARPDTLGGVPQVPDVISPIAATRIISFTIKAADSEIADFGDSLGFVDELNAKRNPDESSPFVTFDWGSIKLLQEAIIAPDSLSFHVRPAAKPASSFENSSWGRIKEKFAD